jgi:galacturonokinase
MEFPDLAQAQHKLIDFFSKEKKISPSEIRVIASPYRICPLGAHIDHQGGPVLGMTINAYTLLAFVPTADAAVGLQSRNYPGIVQFELARPAERAGISWGIYARAAARALQEEHPLARGLSGILDGMLPGCGLSSSASVLLAYLHALAAANHIRLEPWDYVRLTRRAENNFIGLNNGILDQTSIMFGRRKHLLHIDTRQEKVSRLPDPLGESHYRIIVAYSGYSRELTTSGYNSRVRECREAARLLSQISGCGPAQILSDVPAEAFQLHGHKLAPEVGRRAEHFFSEIQRVNDGVVAWQQGRIEEFGRLMVESCRSSIESYECGIQPIYDLQQIVSSADGVAGSRFMGGGFGGCVVGLVKHSRAATAAADIHKAYRQLHPEVADQTAVYLARSADGVRFL